ncbi:hypothetical protein G3A49_13430 [Haloferax volcanii]|uniref:Lipoprotein n=1 Tax=Haloferax volcanii TaxID=2246 RepID=A0A6C0V1E1_HALVO|nr:hypothetical protein [Haloferax alexandrinus]QIB79078.1 hypothetical protein G3A49_13430 [Haloferax alexandrinus]
MNTRRRFLAGIFSSIVMGAGCLSRPKPDPIEIHVRNDTSNSHQVVVEIINLEDESKYRESASLSEGEVVHFEKEPAYLKVGFNVFVDGELKFNEKYRQPGECRAREFSAIIGYNEEVSLSDASCI